MKSWRQTWREKLAAYTRGPFVCLLRLFAGRMFHGAGDSGAEELDMGIGVLLIFLAMPGTLVSLLMFEKYGSLIRYLRGGKLFDPYVATIPDEYFFIVLSMAVTAGAVLWRWDSIFLDRRDYANLVPLPVSLKHIFLANLTAVFSLAAVLTIVVNAGSFFLFPIAVQGSQNSVLKLFRYAWGHCASVILASVFSFLAVFAFSGCLLAVLPYRTFRKISLYVRFLIALSLLAMLASSFTAASLFSLNSQALRFQFGLFPPIWFLGVTETLWGRGSDTFFAAMAHHATIGLSLALLLSVIAYALSFRRSFVRIPETTDVGPLPRLRRFRAPGALLDWTILRAAHPRACYHFVSRTLLRSEAHLQVVLAFAALGVIVAAQTLRDVFAIPGWSKSTLPAAELLSIPFILGYCVLVGMRFAFEMPADLRANWLFRLWISSEGEQARPLARRVLLTFTLAWLAPACFLYSIFLWGWLIALLHTAIVVLSCVVLVEVLLVRFRKIPFTCPYPAFQSYSTLVLVAALFGFIAFAVYLPDFEEWSLTEPWRVILFITLVVVILLSLKQYRKQMLDMDKQLVFEDPAPSGF
jgi:hypothetical protein